MIAFLTFQAGQWFGPAAVGAAVALVLLLVSYGRSGAPPGVRLACAALKMLGVLALLACLVEPVWTGERPRPGANKIALVADNSASLQLRGKGEPSSRADAMRRTLTGDGSAWRQQLAQTFTLSSYLADARLQPTSDFHELDFSGHASRLGAALQSLGASFRGQPLTGILLLTDGTPTDLRLETLPLEGLPPVYPVLFGQAEPERDLALGEVSVTQTSFEDAPVTIQAEVAAMGFAGQQITGTLTLRQADGKELPTGTQTATVAGAAAKVSLRFQFRPEQVGTLFYRLHVEGKTTPVAQEATAANNDRLLTVERGRGPYRILYVSGRPNWEYKFLHRAIEADEQTQLVGLIRIARREPKFEFRGRAGESSNPLFRGFGQQAAEEVERYDQPVFVRLNTRDVAELHGGFPKTAEELFGYQGIIFDDLEAEFFSAEQMALVQQYVGERGGGLLMLGGMESFGEGKYDRTPIGDLLPVYLQHRPEDVPPPGAELHLALTREGWLQPWVRLRAEEGADRQRLADLPGFDVLNPVSAVKPGATVLATVTDGQRAYPALVTQRFGRGRTGALLIGDLWQSGLGDEERIKDLEKSWRQMLRWLVADVPNALELRAEPSADGQAMQIQVRARDAKFQPLDNAQVHLKIQRIGDPAPEHAITLAPEPSASEPGLYQASYVPRESGGYLAHVEVATEDGAAAGQAEAGWSTDFAADEYRRLTPDRALFEELARRTGGRVLAPEELGALARELPRQQVPIRETFTQPIWHTSYVFLFALACLVAEWGLRRRNGLA